MENKNISVFVESFVPDFVNQEHPDFVVFLKNYLNYIERYNQVKSFNLLSIEAADYDPEQDGTFYQGVYFNLDYTDDQVNLVKGLTGSLIKGSISNAIYQVEDVVFSILDTKYLLKVKPTTSKLAVDGEVFSEVDIGEYTQIANLLLFRDIDESLDEFIAEHAKEYLSGMPANLSSDVKNLIKNIRAYYISKGTEQSFRFLFRAIWGSEISFYFPKVDILRVSDGNWYQPYFVELVDDTNIQDFENLSIVGETSGTRADVEQVVVDFSNIVLVSQFFNWEDLTNLGESNDGLVKTDPSIGFSNNAARTSETGLENFGLRTVLQDNAIEITLSDSTALTGIGQATSGFSIRLFPSGDSAAFHDGVNLTASIPTASIGDVIEIREDAGAIKYFRNSVLEYTFSQPLPSLLYGRISLFNDAGEYSDIQNTNQGATISVPKFLEVTIQEGQLLAGENITDIKTSGTMATIDAITKQDGYWTDDDGKISSTKVLQDNYFYQDLS